MQPLTTKIHVKSALPPIVGAVVPTIYMGMPPLEVVGVGYGSTVDIRGLGSGGIALAQSKVGTKGIGQRTIKPYGNGKTKGRIRKATNTTATATNKSVRRIRKGIRKTTSKGTSKIRVISLKNGRKVYMRNGKFIKKGG